MKYLLICCMMFLYSCNRPECSNTNPVFDQYAPTSNEYKKELVKQLNTTGRNKLTYWIDKYMMIDGVEYMSVAIQGHGLCAKGVFDITNVKKLDHFKAVKGNSYSGAELNGFKYRIDSANDHYNFVYEDVVVIVD